MGFFSSTSTQDSNSNSNSSLNASGSSKPLYDDKALFNRDAILDLLGQMVSNGPQGVKEYQSAGLANIDHGAEIKRRMAENYARSRGLNNTSAGNSYINSVDSGNVNDKVNFLNTIPLFAQQQQRQNVGDLSSFFSSLPVGQSTNQVQNGSQSGTQHSTATQPGGIFQDLLGAAAGAAGLYFGGKKK